MKPTRNQIIIIAVGLTLILVIVLIFVFGARRAPAGQLSGTITFWGVFDEPNVIHELITDYTRRQPKVQIQYRQFNPNSYESDLVNGLATAKGPDLFMFHNTWLPKHFDKLWPLTESQLPLIKFRELFPTVVEQDFAPDGVIYALPLYIDTLALFYNKDFFDTKGIALPPKTWEEFQNVVPRLRELDRSKIIRAAAAIGGSNKSINRASDILNLLMLQAGTPMVSSDFSAAQFADGLQSLIFYTQFANPASPYFTWNENLPYSIDNFIEGTTAMMFNYSHQIALIKEKNPFLNFGIAPMPQPRDAKLVINWPNYWGLAVSAKSPNAKIAWDFALWLTTDAQNSLKYLKLTNRPPALRSLIPTYANNPELSVFAQQALTARSWPQIDNTAVENAFSEMIELVISGKSTPEKAIQRAQEKITELMRRRPR